MSSEWTTKEQCSKCNCIVKEREISGGRGTDDCNTDGDCTEVYRKLGSCLNQCLKQKCREYQKKKSGRGGDNCDW